MASPLAIELHLPPALRALFPGSPPMLEVEAATIDEAIHALDRQWPGMRDRLCDSTPRIRQHINVFIEGRRAALETPLQPGAVIHIMIAMRGG